MSEIYNAEDLKELISELKENIEFNKQINRHVLVSENMFEKLKKKINELGIIIENISPIEEGTMILGFSLNGLPTKTYDVTLVHTPSN